MNAGAIPNGAYASLTAPGTGAEHKMLNRHRITAGLTVIALVTFACPLVLPMEMSRAATFRKSSFLAMIARPHQRPREPVIFQNSKLSPILKRQKLGDGLSGRKADLDCALRRVSTRGDFRRGSRCCAALLWGGSGHGRSTRQTSSTEGGPPPRGDRSALWIIGIVTSVCGAILSPYLLAITEFLSRITINAIGFFYHGYVDSIYAHAVINPSDFPIFIIFSLIYVLPIIGMLSMMLLRPIVVRIAQRRPPPKERNMYIIFTLILLVLTAITFGLSRGRSYPCK